MPFFRPVVENNIKKAAHPFGEQLFQDVRFYKCTFISYQPDIEIVFHFLENKFSFFCQPA
jgi:hypothetical protein